ncbi:hypothetical protein AB4176_04885 [Vibrio splendidus]
MNINKINKNIAAKNSRNPRPFATFFDISESTSKAMAEVSSLSVSDETLVTLKNNQIINMVTAVEVYFRDMLDAIFKMCERESFEGKLKKLHDKTDTPKETAEPKGVSSFMCAGIGAFIGLTLGKAVTVLRAV